MHAYVARLEHLRKYARHPGEIANNSNAGSLLNCASNRKKIGTKKLKNAEMECADLYVQYVHKNALR